MKILITTWPFNASVAPLDGHEVARNDEGRKLSRSEFLDLVKNNSPDIVIAGTERYDAEAMDLAPDLKMISRVGIGVDSVDLDECSSRGVVVTNTPDAPSVAVAELTICQMINMARRVQEVDGAVRSGAWRRHVGFDLANETVGVVGCGRIGSLVVERLSGFGCKILVNDVVSDKAERMSKYGAEVASLGEMLKRSRVVSLHVPMTDDTKGMISSPELETMGSNSCLVNMSRGGIIDENALLEWLRRNPEAAAAIDTFEDEPYSGELLDLRNCYVTPHMGSCTEDSRRQMESGAVEEIRRFLTGGASMNRVV